MFHCGRGRLDVFPDHSIENAPNMSLLNAVLSRQGYLRYTARCVLRSYGTNLLWRESYIRPLSTFGLSSFGYHIRIIIRTRAGEYMKRADAWRVVATVASIHFSEIYFALQKVRHTVRAKPLPANSRSSVPAFIFIASPFPAITVWSQANRLIHLRPKARRLRGGHGGEDIGSVPGPKSSQPLALTLSPSALKGTELSQRPSRTKLNSALAATNCAIGCAATSMCSPRGARSTGKTSGLPNRVPLFAAIRTSVNVFISHGVNLFYRLAFWLEPFRVYQHRGGSLILSRENA